MVPMGAVVEFVFTILLVQDGIPLVLGASLDAASQVYVRDMLDEGECKVKHPVDHRLLARIPLDVAFLFRRQRP